MDILGLPKECLTMILSYLPYYQISRCRCVCRDFDQICQQLLHDGFIIAKRMTKTVLQQATVEFKKISALYNPRTQSHAWFVSCHFIETFALVLNQLLSDNCYEYCCVSGFLLHQIFHFLNMSVIVLDRKLSDHLILHIAGYVYASMPVLRYALTVRRRRCSRH